MLDFEDVTPRKKDAEHKEEQTEERKEIVSETAETSASEEVPAENSSGAEEVSPEGAEASMQEEIPKEEPNPQPSVREYHYEEQVKKSPKKKKGWARFVAGCLIIGIAGGGSIGAGYSLVDHLMTGRKAVSGAPAGTPKSSAGEIYSFTEIIKAVKPSVVSVSTKISGMTSYWGAFSVPFESEGAGSGVIFYSDDSRVAIATNYHVIENANTIYVTFEGDVSVPAKVIGTRSESDLAVLTVNWKDLNDAGIEQVTTAVFGDSDALEVGSEVIAIGNAMGMGLSATDGIISMKEQTINVDGNKLGYCRPVRLSTAATAAVHW